jgi:hypothetical protein
VEYPALSSASSELAAVLDADEEFDRGLDSLLDGLAARLPNSGSPLRA